MPANKRKQELEMVIQCEGGIVQDVFYVNTQGNHAGDVEHTILDWDMFEGDLDADIAERWSGFPQPVRDYIERHLPDEFSQFQDCIKRASEPEPPKPPTPIEALLAITKAAKSWHEFHHPTQGGTAPIQCDEICKALPAAEEALRREGLVIT